MNITKDLLERIAVGDVQAFSILYKGFSTAVFNAAMIYTRKDVYLSEEVVQVVFIKVWENRTKLIFLDKPEAYIYTLARNLVFDIFKELTRQRFMSEPPPAHSVSPEGILIVREYGAIFRRAIDSLSPQQKLIYQLAREEGISHAHIAAQTGLTIHTVRTHLKLATRAVREYVGRHIDDPDFLMVIFFLAALEPSFCMFSTH